MESFTPTSRTTLKRLPKRGEYDRAAVYQILDEAFVCHVGFAVEGQPYVIPTGYGRIGDRLYIHGSAASRMLRSLADGIDVCVTVTLIDGLVVARSAFHHSLNYRSVVALGKATVVEEEAEKWAALEAITNHIVPNRWAESREPNEQELRATLVLVLPLVEVSAKVRTGPPIDDDEDYELPIWAGVVPLQLTAASPIADPRLAAGLEPPPQVRHYTRDGKRVSSPEEAQWR